MQNNQNNGIIGRLERSVYEALEGNHVSSVVAGISGGADSVALLRALINLNIKVFAVHCNFRLRGEESERDQRFVENLCRKFNINLEVVVFDVDEYRKENGGSVEMACRELRYEYFERKRISLGAQRIAVAHNSEDNAETVLLNLFRGSGISGLRAMKPDTGIIIRPLLSVCRKEIEEYLKELGQDFIVDSSNLSSDYRRNFIRNEVIPLIEREWPDVKRSLNKTASIMRGEEAALDALTSDIVKASCVPYELLSRENTGRLMLRRFVLSKGATDEIVDQIFSSLAKSEIRKGAKWMVKAGEFILGPSGLEWLPGQPLPEGSDLSERFECNRIRNNEELMKQIKKDRSNSIFWSPVDPSNLIIRTRIAGDRMHPLGMTGSRLVSDIISDSRLSARERRDMAVVQDKDSGEILWVENLRRSRKKLILPTDEYVWQIKRK